MIRVALGDGNFINVQTDDPQAAAAAARKYVASQKQPEKKSFADTITGTMAGAVDKLKADAKAHYDTTTQEAKTTPNLLQAGQRAVGGLARTAGLVGDVVGVAASPFTGVAEAALVQPAANLADQIPLDAYAKPELGKPQRILNPQEKHDANANAMRTALSAVNAPGAPGPKAVPRVVPNVLAEKVAQFDRAGVEPSLAAVKGGAAAKVANVAAENIAGVRPRAQMRRQAVQAGVKAEDIAQGYGDVRGPQVTGENVQAGVNRFAKDGNDPTSFTAKADKVYNDAFAAIPNGAVQPAEVTATLQGILSRVSAPNLAGILKNPQIEGIAKALTADQGKVMFSDLRALRTWVREAQKSPELRQNISSADLQNLEGSLTRDIYSSAETLGGDPRAAPGLQRADQFYAAGQNRIKTALTSFDKANSGESAYSRILQSAGSTGTADAQKLLSLKRSLASDEWGDVSANIVSELGKPTRGAPGVTDPGAFSVGTFVTNYAKLSPRGREILFGATGGGGSKATSLKGELDNLAKVADMMKAVEKGANVSNSGTAVQGAATIAGLAFPGAWPITLKTMGAMAGAGEAMTNPAFVRWLARTPAAAKTAPAWSGHLKALEAMTRANIALTPLYEALSHPSASPGPTPVAAETGSTRPAT